MLPKKTQQADNSSPKSNLSSLPSGEDFFDQSASSNILSCRKCKKGKMLPSIEEGDVEYTDNFVCNHCQHHDTIPTRDLLFSQAFTG